jgi:hypothetical protein
MEVVMLDINIVGLRQQMAMMKELMAIVNSGESRERYEALKSACVLLDTMDWNSLEQCLKLLEVLDRREAA